MGLVDWESLLVAAMEVRERAYAPYSRFTVGAAILTTDGSIHTGANVENKSYGLTICAERNAVFNAVCAGKRDFAALALFTDITPAATPCGACRQVLREFSDILPILIANKANQRTYTSIAELLPDSFGPRFSPGK